MFFRVGGGGGGAVAGGCRAPRAGCGALENTIRNQQHNLYDAFRENQTLSFFRLVHRFSDKNREFLCVIKFKPAIIVRY
jgi:hypothetical protein